jgi:galactose-1-phosphate uridylyltransferase
MPNVSTIIEQSGVNNIMSQLNQIPQQIFDQKSKVKVAREKFKEAEDERATREAELMAIITSEVSPSNGKLLYSNAESRQAALMRDKSSDPDYLDAAALAKKAE